MKTTVKIQPVWLLAGLALVAGGVLGKVGWDRLGAVSEEFAAVEQEQAKPGIGAILADPDGIRRTRENVKQIKEMREGLEKKLENLTGGWKEGSAKASAADQPWSKDPGAWKDELIRARAGLLERSRQTPKPKRVEFAEDFYLGLDEFRQKNPSEAEVPALARELQVARHLTELLIASREAASEAYVTACRVVKLEGLKTGTDSGGSAGAKAQPPAGTNAPAAHRLNYRLTLQCSPEVLYELMSRLARDPWLLIAKNLQVTNPTRQFPSRSEKMKSFGPAADSGKGEAGGASGGKLLEVLAGKEALQIVLEVEYVDWSSPALLAEMKKPGAKP